MDFFFFPSLSPEIKWYQSKRAVCLVELNSEIKHLTSSLTCYYFAGYLSYGMIIQEFRHS